MAMHQISISGSLEVAEAQQAHDALRSALSDIPQDDEVSIEISTPEPTQIAMQLLFAALKSAGLIGVKMVPGENADAIIQTTLGKSGA
jgi:hypothetical protein